MPEAPDVFAALPGIDEVGTAFGLEVVLSDGLGNAFGLEVVVTDGLDNALGLEVVVTDGLGNALELDGGDVIGLVVGPGNAEGSSSVLYMRIR